MTKQKETAELISKKVAAFALKNGFDYLEDEHGEEHITINNTSFYLNYAKIFNENKPILILDSKHNVISIDFSSKNCLEHFKEKFLVN